MPVVSSCGVARSLRWLRTIVLWFAASTRHAQGDRGAFGRAVEVAGLEASRACTRAPGRHFAPGELAVRECPRAVVCAEVSPASVRRRGVRPPEPGAPAPEASMPRGGRSMDAMAGSTPTCGYRSPTAATCAASTACPRKACPFCPAQEILNFEEIARVAGVARSLGVRSLRLTGGEPLVRRGIVELVRQLSRSASTTSP